MLRANWKAACAVAAASCAGVLLFHHQPAPPSGEVAAHSQARAATKPAPSFGPATNLSAALAQGFATAKFEGNGREEMTATIRNHGGQGLHLHIPAGQLFSQGENSVVLVRSVDVQIDRGDTQTCDLETAATRSSNVIARAEYKPAQYTLGNLDTLLSLVGERPDVSPGAIQTAVLALTENLPVGAFAKFPEPGSDLPTRFDTNAFKVENVDIIAALTILRELGCPDDHLALAIDPQLQVEAMIDPLAHAAAMRYYGITSETEWNYWKNQLQNGSESTRHYALYGIARYFPQVALDMLPRWARESRTSPVFRLSAIQALALTERPQALSELRQLEHEFGGGNDLGETAHHSADLLEAHLVKSASPKKMVIAFHASGDMGAAYVSR